MRLWQIPAKAAHLYNIYRASTEQLLILNIYRTYTSIEDLLNIYRNDRTSIDHRSSIYQTSTEHLSGGKIASKLPPSDETGCCQRRWSRPSVEHLSDLCRAVILPANIGLKDAQGLHHCPQISYWKRLLSEAAGAHLSNIYPQIAAIGLDGLLSAKMVTSICRTSIPHLSGCNVTRKYRTEICPKGCWQRRWSRPSVEHLPNICRAERCPRAARLPPTGCCQRKPICRTGPPWGPTLPLNYCPPSPPHSHHHHPTPSNPHPVHPHAPAPTPTPTP